MPEKSTYKPIRWTLSQAASEFGMALRTIGKRMKAAGTPAGKDGKFSTNDIHAAICGDWDKERTRKMKADADRSELDTAERRRELVDLGDWRRRYETIWASCRQRIMGSTMSDADKDSLLNDLAKLHSD